MDLAMLKTLRERIELLRRRVFCYAPPPPPKFATLEPFLEGSKPVRIRTYLHERPPKDQNLEEDKPATTNVQNRFVQFFLFYLFFSFVLIELKPFVLKGKVPGEKLWKSAKKCEKLWNDFAL